MENLGIGDTSPASLLTVGSGDLFQVNSSGAIAAAAGITSSGTINFSGLTASQLVLTDASKNLVSSGTLGVGLGGTGTSTALTQGSVVFAGASGVYSQDDANLYWDDTNNRLGIGTASPSAKLHVIGSDTSTSGFHRDNLYSYREVLPSADVSLYIATSANYGYAKIPAAAAHVWGSAYGVYGDAENYSSQNGEMVLGVEGYGANFMNVSVKAAGEKPAADAEAGKAAAKAECDTMMAEAGALIAQVKEMLDKAPRGKGTQADLEMLKSDLAGVESSLADAQNSFNAEKYLDAKSKVEAAMGAANNVKSAIEAAIAAKGKK